MKKITFLFCVLVNVLGFSQGYDIKVNIKGAKDTMVYLAKYNFDKQYIVDTCKKVKAGNIVFKGKNNLDKGVYFLVSQEKVRYFDFFVNENSKITITSDMSDMVNSLKAPGSKENEDFFGYIKFITQKNIEFGKVKEQTKGLSKADSTKLILEKMKVLNESVQKFDADYMKVHANDFLGTVLNLKTDKELKDIPKASNGRPDSVAQYKYYKAHYWDGVDLKDDRLLRTPFFADRVKRYFDRVILQLPDTITVEIERFMSKAVPGSDI